ncbi:hypothetical protein [Streptomyces canus]|uniref:hypothetical protein n=1 Tax=Streptomyces canus TaxID=58343 RepID=UPI002E34AA4F|nr:hypothetical protein [Streptomyces canus]
MLPGGPPCTGIAPWPKDGAPPTIDVIAKDVESIVTILDVKGGYGGNDFVNQEPAEVDVAELGNRIKNPVGRLLGRERTLMQAAEHDAPIEKIGKVFSQHGHEPPEDVASSVVTFDCELDNPPFSKSAEETSADFEG